MRDFLLYVAGWLSMTTALVHSWLDETDVFARVRIEPERLRSLIRLVWHCSAVSWGWHCYSTERCAKDGVAGPGSSMRCSIKGALVASMSSWLMTSALRPCRRKRRALLEPLGRDCRFAPPAILLRGWQRLAVAACRPPTARS